MSATAPRRPYLSSPAAAARRGRLQREKARILAGNLFQQDTVRLAEIRAELDSLLPVR